MSSPESNPPSISGSKSVLYPDQINFSEKRSLFSVHRCLIILLVLLHFSGGMDVCETMNCVEAASMVAEKMDFSVDPCDDFAEYACGNFYRTATMAEGETTKDAFSMLRDENNEVLKSILTEETKAGDPDYVTNMKKLYQSCMDEAKIEEIGLQPVLDSSCAKEWPTLIGQNWPDEATFDLNEVMIRYMKNAVEPIFTYSVGQDLIDPSRYTINIYPPFLDLSRKFYLRPRNDTILQAYERYLREFAIELGADTTVAAQDAAAYVDLQRRISNIKPLSEEWRDRFKMYNPTTLGDLQTNYSFLEMARSLRAGFSAANMTLSDNQDIIVLFPSYLEKLKPVLESADKRALMNLFGFKCALSRAGRLTKKLREIHLEWSKVYSGKKEATPRWKSCLAEASTAFSLGIAKEFTSRKFSEDSKHYMNVMIDNLKESFRNIIYDADWMLEKTKKEAYQKLDRMGRKIGYPDADYDEEHFVKKYENLTMSPDVYYNNRRTIFWGGLVRHQQRLRKPKDKNEWFMPPYIVNAYYSPSNNEIAFPAGILQPPFFSDIFPDALNYGAIGVFIGHEMTHGFDDQGKQHDFNGGLRNWWQPEDEMWFKNKSKCIVNQYGNFRDESVGLNLDGIITQGENVADNGGLKEGFSAYKKLVQEKGEAKQLPCLGLTNDQLFFLGFSQLWCSKRTREATVVKINNGPHSPGRFRILGPLQNSPDFAKAYKCPEGSKMNPVKKCSVW